MLTFANLIRERRETADSVAAMLATVDTSSEQSAHHIASSVLARIEHMHTEIVLLHTQKDELENELSSSTLQLSMLRYRVVALIYISIYLSIIYIYIYI